MSKTVLEVKNLTVDFGSGAVVLDRVSFTVQKGQALAVIGPNGAGKSVLFRALLGLVNFSGEVRWQEGVKIGYVPQKLPIDRDMPITVMEFLLLKSRNFWRPSRHFLEHLHHELRLVGLSENILKLPLSALSGGELQRLLIAWVMLKHPDVLLFDEPTAGVDVGFEETIYNVIRKMQQERGTTVMVISHDLNVVYRFADIVLCLNKKLLCLGKPKEALRPDELAQLYGEGAFYRHDHGH
jgi:zinc transport system ATP-binding protein